MVVAGGGTLHHAHARVGVAGAEGRGSEGSAPAHPPPAISSQVDWIELDGHFQNGAWALGCGACLLLVAAREGVILIAVADCRP